MFLDHRTYTLRPGALKAFLELYEREGLPIQRQHLGEPFGWFTTEVGNVNQVVHMWLYSDLNERDRRRKAMVADPRWPSYLSQATPLIVTMENTILRPAAFAPVAPPPR
jgi:hypothetical protein